MRNAGRNGVITVSDYCVALRILQDPVDAIPLLAVEHDHLSTAPSFAWH